MLGLDRDVIVRNLEETYKSPQFAREYLDKIADLQKAICYRGDGEERRGIHPFARWIARTMDYNPRKVERFVFLFDYKTELRGKGKRTEADLFQMNRQTVLFTALDLKWPHVSSEILKNTEVLEAINRLVEAGTDEAEVDVTRQYKHLGIIEELKKDRELLLAWRAIEKISRDETEIPSVKGG
jgi:hypothetical protein